MRVECCACGFGRAQVVSAGADGLVKLWGVRTSECTATFDEHEGKVHSALATLLWCWSSRSWFTELLSK
jgi:WD40 repeat protein